MTRALRPVTGWGARRVMWTGPRLVCGLLSLAWCLVAGVATAGAVEISGYVAGEGRAFFGDPWYAGQAWQDVSVAGQPTFYHRWENGSSVTFTPFGRLYSADPERSHVDLRELNVFYPQEEFEVRVGVGRVFWGATEFVHLVDIINQTDLVEHIHGEDKLGQPMFQFALLQPWGRVDCLIMPYFRERTFPGPKGRLRPALPIDPDEVIYESPDGEHRWDLALRYSHSLGPVDFGIFLFNGTDREPLLYPTTNSRGQDVLGSFYQETEQIGGDLQWSRGNWLWKLEALYKHGYFDGYFAATGGVEYTFVNVGGTGADLGLVCEYVYDDRGEEATTVYRNNAMVGLRWSPNDAATSQVLLGWIQDVDDSSKIAVLEASRRLGTHWRLSLDVCAFMDVPPENRYYGLQGDDFARLELAYYF